MTEKFWYFAAAAVLLVGVFFLGRLSVGEKIVTVPLVTELPPIDSGLLPATVDSADYLALLREIGALRATSGEIAPPETVIFYDSAPGVFRATVETTLSAGARVYAVQDEDTLRQSADVSIRVKAEYYGDPINAFRFSRLAVLPFTVKMPLVERVREGNSLGGGWLALEIMPGLQGGLPTIGGEMRFGTFGFGAFASPWNRPLYFVAYHVPIL